MTYYRNEMRLIRMEIRLGPAGNCLLSKGEKTLDSLKNLVKMGLKAQEIEFVRGTYMGNYEAKKVGELAKKLDIKLSVHSSYYINLASKEPIKIEQSKKRILDSAERMHHMGGGPVVFHPSYFSGQDKEHVYNMTKEAVLDMMKTIKKNKWKCQLASETTGKHSAFGSLDETIRLVNETGCSICVDFAHLYARRQGIIDYAEILDKLKPLMPRLNHHLHIHFSNIEFTDKGERKHLLLSNRPPFEPLAKEILDRKLDVTIISESPATWEDAQKMRKIFERLGHRF